MPDSDVNQAYLILADLQAQWEADGTGRVPKRDTERLRKLAESDSLAGLWDKLIKARTQGTADTRVRLFLIELFDAARKIPSWSRLAGSKRRKRLEQVDRAVERLSSLIEDVPFQYLTEESIRRMGLEVRPELSSPGVRRVKESDFAVVLDDISRQAADFREATPMLGRPSHEDAHRRYFVLRVARYLRRRFQTKSNRYTAELARIMLRDETIDTETVRNILRPQTGSNRA